MDLSIRMTKNQTPKFVAFLQKLSNKIGFKVSSRGWAYILENHGFCTKDQFSKVEELINRCRKNGLLPVDFVAEEKSREFDCVHTPTDDSYPEHIRKWVEASFDCYRYYALDWWENEEYYIQMIVEKVDLVNLFSDLCNRYHIPIANARGWSSILQRAEYCRRFKEAEDKGLQCVLLYCGDHDPDGLRISDTIRTNLEDIQHITWDDGTHGYDPENLIIERFGLDYDFIIKNKLTWIDNLITGNTKKKMDLGDPKHPNHNLPYVKNYLKKVGRRKCEANSLVTAPEAGRELCRKTIVKYLGEDALDRFAAKRKVVKDEIAVVFQESGARQIIQTAIEALDEFDNQ
jgi:hypothetical protein